MDGDPVDLLLKWVHALATRRALLELLERTITETETNALQRDESLILKLDWNELARNAARIATEQYSQSAGPGTVTVVVRHWSPDEAVYTDYWVSFSREQAEDASHIHGNLWCPTSMNTTRGNWLFLQYDMPAMEGARAVLPTHIHIRGPSIPADRQLAPEDHDHRCLYRRRHLADQLGLFSDFGNRVE
jgi:hypothetical protein